MATTPGPTRRSSAAEVVEPEWPLAGSEDLRDLLLAAYSADTRRYHDVRHLAEVVDRLHELTDDPGVALLLAFGRLGVVGRWLDEWFGFTLPFTTLGVVLAQCFVAMPFLVVTVEGAFRGLDQGFEEAASTLGASRLTTFRRVTLPLIAPSLAAGTVLCWARALGEFGATITFAGNSPGITQTMPLAVYLVVPRLMALHGRIMRGRRR